MEYHSLTYLDLDLIFKLFSHASCFNIRIAVIPTLSMEIICVIIFMTKNQNQNYFHIKLEDLEKAMLSWGVSNFTPDKRMFRLPEVRLHLPKEILEALTVSTKPSEIPASEDSSTEDFFPG